VTFGHSTCGASTTKFTSDGQCDPITGGIVPDSTPGQGPYKDGQGNALPVATVPCGASAKLPALPPSASGRACTAKMMDGACAAGNACVAPAGRQCLQQAGDVPCPDGGMTKYLVYAPSDVKDARTCGACSCSSSATKCSNATLTTHTKSDCTDMGIALTVDGNCNGLPAGSDDTNDQYFVYNATPDTMACAPTSATVPVMGTVSVANPVTICCL
jgi:hypothetical protein